MPCPASPEERAVNDAFQNLKVMQSEYPLLKNDYHVVLEIINYLGLEPMNSIEIEEPSFPNISVDYNPSPEQGKIMEAYSEKVVNLLSNIELWLCNHRTALVKYLDTAERISDTEFSEKIEQQIQAHKAHREADRQLVIEKLDKEIQRFSNLIEKSNKKPAQQILLYRQAMEKLEKKLLKLSSHSIDELIRDRSLTEV